MKQPLLFTLLAGFTISSLPAASVLVDFESGTGLADNFTETKNKRFVEANDGVGMNQFARLPGASSGTDSGAILGTGTSTGWTTYLTETVQADVRFASFSGNTASLFTRGNSATSPVVATGNLQDVVGIGARITAIATDSINFELRFNQQSSGSTSGSTSFYDSGSISLAANTLATGTWYTMRLEQTSGVDPQFKFSLLTTSGSQIATTGFQTLTASDDFNAAGWVGFGGTSTTANSNLGSTVDIDNFSVVPEPSSSLLAICSLGAMALRRRR